MPSDGSRLAWLRSQGLGLVCGLATVALLAIGSFVLAATRDGASAGIGMDDLRGFFDPPRLAHVWLYLLFPVAGLYALNTVLATWDTVVRRWRLGVRAPSAYAASVVHVGFLLGLLAHAAAGFGARDHGQVLVSSGWEAIPGFGEARLVSLDVDALPGGMPRAVTARLEVRDGGGVRPATVGYNAPLSTPAGGRLALLGEFGRVRVARLASGADACAVAEGQACAVGDETVRVVAIGAGAGGGPSVLVRARGPSGREEVRWLGAGGDLLALAGGRPLRLDAVAVEPGVVLRVREAPGDPWALAAAVVLTLGVLLMWRKLAR